MIVANNRSVFQADSEPKPVQAVNRDLAVAYIQLSESGYCRHNRCNVVIAHGKMMNPQAFLSTEEFVFRANVVIA